MLTVNELLSRVNSTKRAQKAPNVFYDAMTEIISVKEIGRGDKVYVKITIKSREFPIYASALYTLKGGSEKQIDFCLRKLADIVSYTGLSSGELSDLAGRFVPAVISRGGGEYWNASLLPTEREQSEAMRALSEWKEQNAQAVPPPPVNDDIPF